MGWRQPNQVGDVMILRHLHIDQNFSTCRSGISLSLLESSRTSGDTHPSIGHSDSRNPLPQGSSDSFTRDFALVTTSAISASSPSTAIVAAAASPSPVIVGSHDLGMGIGLECLQPGKIAASASVSRNSIEARSSQEGSGDASTSQRASLTAVAAQLPNIEKGRQSNLISSSTGDPPVASVQDQIKGLCSQSSHHAPLGIGRKRSSLPSSPARGEGDDLDEGDVLFACEDAKSSPGAVASPISSDLPGPCQSNPHEQDHLKGIAIPESQHNHRQWAAEDEGQDPDHITGGGADLSTLGAPSSLRPDLAQRLNLNCRASSASSQALSFSLSFVNHMGVRRKVGFLYNLEEDEPVHIANEMIEDLSLKEEEAALIAQMIQEHLAARGASELPPEL